MKQSEAARMYTEMYKESNANAFRTESSEQLGAGSQNNAESSEQLGVEAQNVSESSEGFGGNYQNDAEQSERFVAESENDAQHSQRFGDELHNDAQNSEGPGANSRDHAATSQGSGANSQNVAEHSQGFRAESRISTSLLAIHLNSQKSLSNCSATDCGELSLWCPHIRPRVRYKNKPEDMCGDLCSKEYPRSTGTPPDYSQFSVPVRNRNYSALSL